MLAALAATGRLPAGNRLHDIVPASGFGLREVLDIRAELHEIDQPMSLVLDDFHVIDNAAVLESLGRVIEHPPPLVNLVLSTRSDPPLPLHRLRVRGGLTEVRAADLAFSADEAEQLFAMHGLNPTDGQLEVLLERTQGWPAGLRLAAMSLTKAELDTGIARLSGTDRAIADYLTAELVRNLRADDREFLLRTSVCRTVSAELADALTDRADSGAVLDRLVEGNAFVVALGGPGGWYSYHPMVRDLLAHQLSMENSSLEREMHRRSAQWRTGHGDLVEAIRHAIASRDDDLIASTVIGAVPRILSVEGPALATALAPLAAQARRTPSLVPLLAAATCHLHQRQLGAMHRDAVEARDYLRTADPAHRAPAAVLIALFDMAGNRSSGDLDRFLAAARHALELLDRVPPRLLPAGRQYWAIATANLGVGMLLGGSLDEAEAYLADAEEAASELDMPLAALNAAGHRAIIDAFSGRLDRADFRARACLELIDRRGWNSEIQAMATFVASTMVAIARHWIDDAASVLDRGLMASTGSTDRSLRLAFGISAVRLAVSRGDGAAAVAAAQRLHVELGRTSSPAPLLVRWGAIVTAEAQLLVGRVADALAALGEHAEPLPALQAMERVARCRVSLARGDTEAAAEMLDPVLHSTGAPLEAMVEAHLLQALIFQQRHWDTPALAAVQDAIALAAPERVLRPFVVVGGPLKPILSRHRVALAEYEPFTTMVVEAVASELGGEQNALLVERLTPRETIVLQYLPSMLKAAEIAANLFVSVNTVKAHIRSIYRKLDAANRREAVERAESMGLL